MKTLQNFARKGLIFFPLVVLLTACPKDKTDEEKSNFDRKEMLSNYAKNLIVPAYNDLKSALDELNAKTTLFTNTPNSANLLELQNQWTLTYTAFQYCSAYNFGPAQEQGLTRSLSEEIATFPVSESKIEAAISSPNFSDFNRDARGFLAFEYLVFKGTSDEIINQFSDVNRKNYLLGLVENIQSRVNSVASQWDSYQNTFINNNGTDAGSGTSMLYNEFLKNFESIKNYKLELPLGKRPGQIQAEPQLVEAYYSGQSLVFLKAHIQAIENIYYGKNTSGNDGLGLLDYLQSVEGGNDLANSTLNQWAQVKSALSNIPASSSLSTQCISSPVYMENLATELQKNTRYFKSDLSSLLGIAITYSSGDGD